MSFFNGFVSSEGFHSFGNKKRESASLPPLNVPPPLRAGAGHLLTLKITLLGIEPPIWRRFVAPSFMRLSDLHKLVQEIMGWEDCHLYEFTIAGNSFSSSRSTLTVDSAFKEGDSYRAENYQLSQLIKSGTVFQYKYDFGDGWEHEIVVENFFDGHGQRDCMYCLDGERACPPEDCGGVPGYETLLEILADPNHPEYEEQLDWVGDDFDSEYFNPREVNENLGTKPPKSLDAPQISKEALKKKKLQRKQKEKAKKRNRK
jgi:hypothetical protein